MTSHLYITTKDFCYNKLQNSQRDHLDMTLDELATLGYGEIHKNKTPPCDHLDMTLDELATLGYGEIHKNKTPQCDHLDMTLDELATLGYGEIHKNKTPPCDHLDKLATLGYGKVKYMYDNTIFPNILIKSNGKGMRVVYIGYEQT